MDLIFYGDAPLYNFGGTALKSVIDISDTPPSTPEEGDRYIVGTGSGDFSGENNKIAEYDGSSWQFTEADENDFVYVQEEEKYFRFTTEWLEVDTASVNISFRTDGLRKSAPNFTVNQIKSGVDFNFSLKSTDETIFQAFQRISYSLPKFTEFAKDYNLTLDLQDTNGNNKETLYEAL